MKTLASNACICVGRLRRSREHIPCYLYVLRIGDAIWHDDGRCFGRFESIGGNSYAVS